MSDLIERLRERGGDLHATHGEHGAALCNEAAAEIERLRRELTEARGLLREAFGALRHPDTVDLETRILKAISADQPPEAERCPATLGNAGQCWKPKGHDGQHSLCDWSKPPTAADKSNPLDMEPGPDGSRVLCVKEK